VKIVQDQHDRFQNFQYDQEAWKSWYAELHTPEEVSLRRDP